MQVRIACYTKIIIISQEDKNFIRKNILDGIKYITEKENIKILKQFTQCIKKILKADYKDIWKNDFLKCVIDCINSQNQKIIYAGIILFYQLSKIYEFEDDENQDIYCEALKLVNDKFIYYIDMCKNMQNNVEALIFNSSTHWYSIRRINGIWFDLNSTNTSPGPEIISDFYLSAFIQGAEDIGYTNFLITNLPKLPEINSEIYKNLQPHQHLVTIEQII